MSLIQLKVYSNVVDVAIKIFLLKHTANEIELIEHEISILVNNIYHKNVLKCFGCHFDKSHAYIITELCSKGDLTAVLKKKVSLKMKIYYLMQIANGMHYLHYKCGIVHRDLKPGNVLVNHMNIIKIADFGEAKNLSTLGSRTSKMHGTLAFMAPEVLYGGAYDRKLCDIYSFGMMMYNVLSSKQPFSEFNIIRSNIVLARKMEEQYKNEIYPDITELENNKLIPKGLIQLMILCWDYKSFNRPQSFSEISEELTDFLSSMRKK